MKRSASACCSNLKKPKTLRHILSVHDPASEKRSRRKPTKNRQKYCQSSHKSTALKIPNAWISRFPLLREQIVQHLLLICSRRATAKYTIQYRG